MDRRLQQVSAGFSVGEWVVEPVGVAVECICTEPILHERIGAREPADERVVDAPVHVDQGDLLEMLVPGVAAVREAGDRICGIVRSVRVTPLTPWIADHDATLARGRTCWRRSQSIPCAGNQGIFQPEQRI